MQLKKDKGFMLHRSGRFYMGGFSFVLPDNIYLNTALEDGRDSGLQLFAPDGSYCMEIYAENCYVDAKAFFEGKDDGLELSAFPRTSPIISVVCGGRSGFCQYYTAQRCGYCEIRFDYVNEELDINTICILVNADKSMIVQLMQSQQIQELLNSIRWEDTFPHCSSKATAPPEF